MQAKSASKANQSRHETSATCGVCSKPARYADAYVCDKCGEPYHLTRACRGMDGYCRTCSDKAAGK